METFSQLRPTRKIVTSLTTLILVLSIGCSSARKTQPPPESRPVDEKIQALPEGAHYQRIKSLYQRKAFETAMRQIRSFEQKYPKSQLIGYVFNFHGLVYFLQKRYPQAITQFQKALATGPDSGFQQYLWYNLGAAQFESKKYMAATQTFSQIEPVVLEPSTRFKFHYISVQLAQKRGIAIQIAHHSLAAAKYIGAGTRRGKSRSRTQRFLFTSLKDSMTKVFDSSELESLYEQHEDSPLADELLYVIGKKAMTESRPGTAEEALRNLVADFPKSRHYKKSLELLQLLQTKIAAETKTVGVLLPMTGRFAKVGMDTLHGIELAFKIFNNEEPDNQVTLIIEDSGSSPETAVRALDKLVFDHRVVAVIGPLLSSGIEEVSERADEVGVPLISLTQRTGEKNEWTFYSAVTPEIQANAIARYAVEKKGIKRFAILHPDDKFGEKYSSNFWDAVEENGGTVTAYEKYPTGTNDFTSIVDKISGQFYTEARSKELEDLEKVREEEGIKRRTHRTDKYFKLPPVIDYEAVFIADDAKGVAQILPTFSYRDVEEVQFLGVATWNSPLIVRRARKHAQGALFVDTFFQSSGSREVRRFVSTYQKTFSERPNKLSASSYDAARLLEHAMLLGAGDSDRRQIRETLARVKAFPGVTGQATYRDGRFERDLKVLTFKGSRVIEAEEVQNTTAANRKGSRSKT
jgi:branched-chain amino acid transport system substrate-binding protein